LKRSAAQARFQRTLGQRATADDDRRLGRRKGFGDFGRQVEQQAGVFAEERGGIGRIPDRTDHEDLGAALDRLAQAGVEQRGFVADLAADDQDRVGFLDPASVELNATAARLDAV
jgi:hypothetical protein